MQTINNENRIYFRSEDCNGEFEFAICKNGISQQIQLTSSMGNWDENAYINVDIKELKAIRDLINVVINEKETK